MREINELELKYLAEFEPEPRDDVERRRATEMVSNHKPYYYVGKIDNRFVYDNTKSEHTGSELEVSSVYVGELAIMPDKELIGLTIKTLDAFNKMKDEIGQYVEKKEEESGTRISWDESEFKIDKKQLVEADIETIRSDYIRKVDERIVKAKLKQIEYERAKAENEAEVKKIGEAEKQGILTLRFCTVTDKRVVGYQNATERVHKITFDKILKIKDNYIYHDEAMKNSTNLSYNTNAYLTFIEPGIKYNRSFDIEFSHGGIVKIKFDDKGHMTINNEKCPKNWAVKVIKDYSNNKGIDIKSTIESYKKLGVKKQLLLTIENIKISRIGESNEDIDMPFKVTPKDEQLADVEFATQTKQVRWDSLIDQFMNGNNISRYNCGSSRYVWLVKNGWTRKDLLYYFRQVIVQENI